MKRTPCSLVLAALAGVLWCDTAHAQYFGARRYTQRLAPQTAQPAPAAPPKPQPAAPPPPATATATAPAATTSEKAREEKDAVLKRTIDFQKKRAEEGSATAQYDLGKRYLNGDGLEKNLAEAKKWFEAAAKQEHAGAALKLEEIKKLEAAPPDKPAKDAPK